MENKRVYIKPVLESETFLPQAYIANCGDSGTIYKFKCDAGGGWPGSVYLETNGQEGLQTNGRNPDRYLSGYYACGTTHEASSDDDFLEGYYVTSSWWGGTKVTEVIVWRGRNGNNTHCTTNLDMDSWETVKS